MQAYIENNVLGRHYGEVGSRLNEVNFEPGLLRPFRDERGRVVVTVNNNGKLENRFGSELTQFGFNLNATSLRKDDWLAMDRAVLRATRQRLKAWGDLVSTGNTFGGFNGMNKMVLEYEAMSDPGNALVDMDGLSEGQSDAPLFKLQGLPLPITHCGFWFSERRLAVSRNSNTPLDTVMAEAAGRRVAETIEKTLIGTITGTRYGADESDYIRNSQVYGYTNYPARITKTDLTTPSGSNQANIRTDVLEMRELLYAAGFYGPFMLYTSTGYDVFLDDLFSTTEPSAGTLRQKIKEIDGIRDIRRLDYLTSGYQMVMVQLTSDVVRAVVGMPITTVQWDTQGGARKMFRVMTIQVPQIRSDYNGNCGVCHGTTS